VLGVSSQYKHKNLATLIRAFKRVHVEIPEVELVLAGQLGSQLVGVRQAEDVPGLISELGLDGVVRATGFIAPHELGALYRGAALFVFPSIFEGFGLPPVEALGFGLPVITTRCASLVEVTRGLADYVDDPKNVDELATLITSRLEGGGRPSTDDVRSIRDFYAPQRIGGELYRLLTDVR
jgi:glycosyltransferase involved in cell wall biosynthesis